MPSRHRVVRWAIIAIAFVATSAGASTLAATPEVLSPEAASRAFGTHIADASRQQALARAPEWRAFTARHGSWKAQWNAITGTPHRATGPSIPLAGFRDDEAGVDAAVRRFIADNPPLFAGAPQLEKASVRLAGNLWYASYRQTIGGVPVLNSDWEFRVTRDGRLAMFGADAHRIPSDLSVTPMIPSPVAREASKSGIVFNPSTDQVAGGQSLYLLPVIGADGSETLRLVTATQVITRRPRGHWFQFVDARNGDIVWRRNALDGIVSGTVKTNVHLTAPLQPTTLANEAWEYVTIGATRVQTNGLGYYEGLPSGFPTTVCTNFNGPACSVVRFDGTSGASFCQSNVSNGATVNVNWSSSNSRDSERDVFFHVNLEYQLLKTIDPSWNFNDFPLTSYVDENSGDECYASFDPPVPPAAASLTFYNAGVTCPNTGTMPDIIWHEYFHATTYYMYYGLGQPFGLQNQALAEGLADAFSALIPGDAVIGNEFFGPGTQLRNVSNTGRWPEDRSPDPHLTGLIIAGAIWNMQLVLGQAKAESLVHFARYGTPDDADDGVAMNEFFLEMLLRDDNDGNLSNGTPHFAAIVNAFNLHGIGTNFYLSVTHTPMEDQNTNGPFLITSTLQYTGPVGSFNTGTLYYSVNNTAYVALPLQTGGNPDEYTAEIPKLSYGVVRYYLIFTDEYGGAKILPGGAPTRDRYTFIVGPSTVIYNQDFETAPPGWVAGVGSDNATTGRWERGDPVGTIAQPEDDHSPFGTQCYVTGNAPYHDPPGLDDVDGGETTLVTALLNTVPTGFVHPIITYWRWYSNNAGDAPGEDYWRVDITNNSVNWIPVESTNLSSNAWVRVVFRVEDYVVPNNQVKLRFLASDVLNPSLVEAAVDDFSMLSYQIPADVPGSGVLTPFELMGAIPNPSPGRATVRYSLAMAGPVSLAVFDLQGRQIATLADGPQEAGAHTIAWNGRDTAGQRVASGLYFLRLRQGAQEQTRRIIMSR
jgi:flagellar hook capping protein FlgD